MLEADIPIVSGLIAEIILIPIEFHSTNFATPGYLSSYLLSPPGVVRIHLIKGLS